MKQRLETDDIRQEYETRLIENNVGDRARAGKQQTKKRREDKGHSGKVKGEWTQETEDKI